MNRVSTCRGLVPRSGVPFNEEVGPSSLANETGGEIRSSFLVLVGRKERPTADERHNAWELMKAVASPQAWELIKEYLEKDPWK